MSKAVKSDSFSLDETRARAAFVKEATQKKCCALVLGIMALLSAAAAGWMFSLGDAGWISGLGLTSISTSFVIGTIIAVVLSVQKFDAAVQSARRADEGTNVPIQIPVVEEDIVKTALERMGKAVQRSQISHALWKLNEEKQFRLFDQVFGSNPIKGEWSDQEKKILPGLIATKPFISYLETKGVPLARQIFCNIDLNDCPARLFETLIVILKTDLGPLRACISKPKRLIKVFQELPHLFLPQAIVPIFQNMARHHKVEFLESLTHLDSQLSSPLADALLGSFHLLNDQRLLSPFKTWPTIVAKYVIDHLSTCNLIQTENLFAAMGDQRQEMTKWVLKSLNDSQATVALFTQWLQQNRCELWQVQLMVQSPQRLVETISPTLAPEKITALTDKMTQEQSLHFIGHFPKHPLAYDEENLIAFSQHPFGQNIFLAKMQSLADEPDWLEEHPLLAKQYFKILVQLESNAIIQSFMQKDRNLFDCVKITWNQETTFIPAQLLASRSTVLKDKLQDPELKELSFKSENDTEAIHAFFTYLETGLLPGALPVSSLLFLARLAHDYDMRHLSVCTCDRISHHLDGHVLEILQEAIKYPLYDLRYLCLGYLSQQKDVKALLQDNPQIPDFIGQMLTFRPHFVIDYPSVKRGIREVKVNFATHQNSFAHHHDLGNERFKIFQDLDAFLKVEHWTVANAYTAISLCLAAERNDCPKIARDFFGRIAQFEVLPNVASYTFMEILFLLQLERSHSNGYGERLGGFLLCSLAESMFNLGYHVKPLDDPNTDIDKVLPFLTIEKKDSSISAENCSFFAKYPIIFIQFIENYPKLYTVDVILPVFKLMELECKESFFMHFRWHKDFQISQPVVDALLRSLHVPEDLPLFSIFRQWPKSVAQYVIEHLAIYEPEQIESLLTQMSDQRELTIQAIVYSIIDLPTTVALFTQWLQQDQWERWQIQLMVRSPLKLIETITPTSSPEKITDLINEMTEKQQLHFFSQYHKHPLVFDEKGLIAFSRHCYGQGIFLAKMRFLANQQNWLEENRKLAHQYFKILVQIHAADLSLGLITAFDAISSFINNAPKGFFDPITLTCAGKPTKGIPALLLAARGNVFKCMLADLTTEIEEADLVTETKELPLISVNDEDATNAFVTYLENCYLQESLPVSSLMHVAFLANHYDMKHLSELCVDRIPDLLDTHLREILKGALEFQLYNIRYVCFGYMSKYFDKDNVQALLSDSHAEIQDFANCAKNFYGIFFSCNYPPKKGFIRKVTIGYDDVENIPLSNKKKRAHSKEMFSELQKLDAYLHVMRWSTPHEYIAIAMCLAAERQKCSKLARSFLICLAEILKTILPHCSFKEIVDLYRIARQHQVLYDFYGRQKKLSDRLLYLLLSKHLPDLGYDSNVKKMSDLNDLNDDAVDTMLPFLAIENNPVTLSPENCDFFAKYPKIFIRFIHHNRFTPEVILQVFPEKDLVSLFTQWMKEPLEWQIEMMLEFPEVIFEPQFIIDSNYFQPIFKAWNEWNPFGHEQVAVFLKAFKNSWYVYSEEMLLKMIEIGEWREAIIRKMGQFVKETPIPNMDLFKAYFRMLCNMSEESILINSLSEKYDFIDRVTLCCNGQETIFSSYYLSLLSPVFRQLIEQSQNNLPCRIELPIPPGLEPKSVQLFFKFLKSQEQFKIDLNSIERGLFGKEMEDLLTLAKTYQIVLLTDEIFKQLLMRVKK